MSTLPLPAHPILACAEQIGACLDGVADTQACYLSTEEKAAALGEIARVESRLAGLRLRVMAAADDVAEAEGCRDVAAWCSHHTLTELDTARADGRLARSLDRDRQHVAEALASGECTLAQARVIVQATDEIPDRVGAEVVDLAETALVGYADRFRPHQLRRLGRRILEVVAPQIAEGEEARRLADQERHAREKTRLRLRPLGDGTTRVSGLLPDATARRLKTFLEAFAAPRQHSTGYDGRTGDTGQADHGESDGQGGRDEPTKAHVGDAALPAALAPCDRVPYPRRLGLAFGALLEHLEPARLPHHGGDATTVMVTLTLDQLRSELATAGLLDDVGDGGEDGLSAEEVRRLACTAQIIPAVLGGESEILDLGRSQRLFTPAQRRALRLRDRRCRAESCTIPATWTEAHHWDPWSVGGPTDLENGVLLCSWHHHRAHDQRFRADRLPSGDVRFRRRT